MTFPASAAFAALLLTAPRAGTPNVGEASDAPRMLRLQSVCGERALRSSDVVVRDSAGIRIVENPASLQPPPLTLSAQPAATIGERSTAQSDLLVNVAGAVRLSNGEVVVADAATREVRVYGARGNMLRRIGRAGQGPGEFQSIQGITRIADTIAVSDVRARRVAFFRPDGLVLRSAPIQALDTATLGRIGIRERSRHLDAVPLVAAALPTGLVLFRRDVMAPMPAARPGAGMSTTSGEAVFFTRGSSMTDTRRIAVLPARSVFRFVSRDGWLRNGDVPFHPTPHAAAAAGRLVTGHGSAFEIQVRNPSGIVTQLIRLCRESVPLARSEVERFVADTMSVESAEARPRAELLYRARPFPSRLPQFGTLLVDVTGRIWVGDYALTGRPQRLNIFDVDGRLVGRTTMPAGFQVLEAGRDFALGRYIAGDGAHSVRMYQIR